MTNTIPNVPRELLERAWRALANSATGREIGAYLDADPCAPECAETCARASMCSTCSALLSAPSPAGVDGLEVVQAVAWLNTATKEATTHPVVVMDWDDEKEPVESLMPISQHEAIIDGLRGEVGAQRVKTCIALKERNDASEERDQHAKRIGELEGLLLRVQVSLSLDDTEWGYSGAEKYKLLADIRAALSAGKEGE